MTSTTTPTSQAIVQDTYGDDVFRLTQIAIPEIATNEVLIRVHAAGLDRGTWHMMAGLPYLLRVIGFGLRRPKNRVPGFDVAGTVAAVGASVTTFAIGDEVFGVAKGSFAEYTAALESKLARKPSILSFAQAAVVPVSGLTALQALRDAGNVKSGQHVLVIGASGGVGSYAVQLAKAFGAQVTGVCSTSKLDLVRSLGADHVIDYTGEDFAAGSTRYDLILDAGGNPSLSRLRRALTPTGTAVIIGGEKGGRFTGGFGRSLRAAAMTPLLKGQRLVMFTSKENADDLQSLTELIQAGKVTPSIDATYPLGKVRQAMRNLQAGNVRGKVAITVIADSV
ncbi:NAD(P)-dependent alcohol dehydrogenase [Allorhizocola rhizosphaerae]|uniref:NAD(P)-dependent alcohol dehydrogenase n=1 Tax=Allorhizocola rhizosphaerae TaxID=1872709 RepID=UPI000E3DA831|nr:NAD(P)-dependent alcohol dehydrogenase [Allorhizocola rhizosphaerae]